jgi:hypothetical protein
MKAANPIDVRIWPILLKNAVAMINARSLSFFCAKPTPTGEIATASRRARWHRAGSQIRSQARLRLAAVHDRLSVHDRLQLGVEQFPQCPGNPAGQ